jgi:segregation and condensation protein A
MIHSVLVPTFEGPLGLLLELAEKGKVELTTISVSDITAKYLAHVNTMSDLEPEELSDFLRLGSRLLYIKSLALLPREAGREGEELQRLSLELAEYRRYQQAARKLSSMLSNSTWQRTAVAKLAAEDLPLPNLKLEVLQEAFTRALKRAEPLMGSNPIDQGVSQESVINSLRRRLKSGSFELQVILDAAPDRFAIIITFLALLELLKTGAATVTQDGQFSPIMIAAPHV